MAKESTSIGKGLDVGTVFIYCAQRTGPEVAFRIQRNAFFDIEYSDFARGILEKSNVEYVLNKPSSRETSLLGRDKIFVMGEEAMKFANAFSRKLRRPMRSGVISPQEEDALLIVEMLIKSVLGLPSEKEEICYYSVPGSPIDADFDTIYHQNVIKGFLEKLGYRPKPLNEGLAVIFSELSEDNFTGIGMSFGGGMTNVCLAMFGVPVFSFSVARAGDWIDEQAARATNQPVSKITTFKETFLDLRKTESNMNKAEQALSIYYEHLIEYVLEQIKKEFLKTLPQLEEPIPIVISGGTVKPAGFLEKFKEKLKKTNFPLKVKEVRLASHPLYTAAKGALIAALAERK